MVELLRVSFNFLDYVAYEMMDSFIFPLWLLFVSFSSVDNSEYMRNGDYMPTRLQAQQDAVNTICRFKLRSNPENNVGLLTLAK